jgi:hypothetical protein
MCVSSSSSASSYRRSSSSSPATSSSPAASSYASPNGRTALFRMQSVVPILLLAFLVAIHPLTTPATWIDLNACRTADIAWEKEKRTHMAGRIQTLFSLVVIILLFLLLFLPLHSL